MDFSSVFGQAMKRNVEFWKRLCSEKILVEFGADEDVTLSATKTKGSVSTEYPPLYDDIPGMLADFEAGIDLDRIKDEARPADDRVGIPIAWPELQFGNGMAGAMFGGKLNTISTRDHTYTFNEPVVSDWKDLEGLAFDQNNTWVKRIMGALRYFIEKAKKPFVVRPFFIYEGADFIVSMRGTTRAFYDFADEPPGLKVLYDLGRQAGIKFFEMKAELLREHNEKTIGNREYSNIAPIHAIPMLDMDAYALTPPETFEKYGFENKQKILDHFGGASFYIHALGRHIIPIAAELGNLTELWLFDDPKCPRYFDDRIKWRRMTHDIPLQFYCNVEEFVNAIDEKTLPGGTKYNLMSDGIRLNDEDKKDIIKKAKAYRTDKLAGRPK
jgi:hypothetical protein